MFAFRDNAFQPKLASVMKHDRAVLLDVFVQSDARPRRAIPGPFVFGAASCDTQAIFRAGVFVSIEFLVREHLLLFIRSRYPRRS